MAEPSTRSAHRRRTSARVRRRRTFVVAGAILLVAAITVTAFALTRPSGETPAADTSPSPRSNASDPAPSPSAEELTAAQQLLADSDDAAACAISFTGEAIDTAPMLQSTGALYAGLPIPARDGAVFAGWYATPEDAAGLAIPGRINGADMVDCDDTRERTLHAGWMTPADNEAVGARVPILMYHQFTSRAEGEDGWLRLNYAYVGDFRAQMEYIAGNGFYLPTWDELAAFIDGRLYLPDHSVIVTDDDADQSWFDLAVPIVDEFKVLSTSFMITAYRQDPAPSPYVLRRSHTHDMHKAGANGEGLMTNLSAEEIAADMRTSADLLGVAEVMAYPFGHHNETSKEGLREAGFEMARTIEQGYVSIGTDKLALPCIRINYGMGVDALQGLIG